MGAVNSVLGHAWLSTGTSSTHSDESSCSHPSKKLKITTSTGSSGPFATRSEFKQMDDKSSTRSRTPRDTEGEPVAKKTRLVHRTSNYDESKPNQWLDDPPLEIWDHVIIPIFIKDKNTVQDIAHQN